MTTLFHELLDVVRAYEQWEADLVGDNKAWQTEDGLPHLTQELYDELMELQAARNAAIARVEGRAAQGSSDE